MFFPLPSYYAAKRLAQAGIKVVCTARRLAKLDALVAEIKALGGEALPVKMDATSDDETRAAFEVAERTYGGVDYVYANAGVEGDPTIPDIKKPAAEAKLIFDANIYGVYLTYQHGIKAMQKRGGGALLIHSSGAAFWNRFFAGNLSWALGMDLSGWSAYSASKSAVEMLARHSHFYLKDGIRTYTLNTAFFKSEMVDRITTGGHGGAGAEEDEKTAALNPFFKHPSSGGTLGMMGNPSDHAELVLSLIANDTQYAPGAAIFIDNDMTFPAVIMHNYIDNPALCAADPNFSGWPGPVALTPWSRDVKGNPYNFETGRTTMLR